MKILPDMWRYAELCSHEPKGNEPLLSNSDYTPMRNDLDYGFMAVFHDSPRMIICFEGTKNLKAWISDFDVLPLREDMKPKDGEWGKGTIADGFYSGWEAFKKPITDYIKNNVEKSVPIFCTGHSRGGALATLCARHIAKNMKRPCSCVSFGAPAQGIKEYRDELNILPMNHTRVVHGYDIVTDLPPYNAGFRHGGNKEWLSESIFHKLPWHRVKDHFYTTYTKGLMKYCKAHEDPDGYSAMVEVLKRAHP